MKITAIRAYQIGLPYTGGTYSWSGGYSVSEALSTVVEIETDAGITGYGESCPLPNYLHAYGEGVPVGVRTLAPALIGADPRELDAVNRRMDRTILGHTYAKSPIDVACWDILGKACGLPVYALLGGRFHDAMPMYRAVPQKDPDVMAGLVAEFRAEGYRQFQLKSGGEQSDQIARIREVADCHEPGQILIADAKRAWTREGAIRVARALPDVDVIIEQPCDGYEACRSVRRQIGHAVKLDECITDMTVLQRAIADDALDMLSVKISRFGGLTAARRIRDMCTAAEIEMTVEDVWGGALVSAAVAHLAASTQPEVMKNTTDLHNYNTVHFAGDAPEVRDGCLVPPDRPGLGVTPDMATLGEPLFDLT